MFMVSADSIYLWPGSKFSAVVVVWILKENNKNLNKTNWIRTYKIQDPILLFIFTGWKTRENRFFAIQFWKQNQYGLYYLLAKTCKILCIFQYPKIELRLLNKFKNKQNEKKNLWSKLDRRRTIRFQSSNMLDISKLLLCCNSAFHI